MASIGALITAQALIDSARTLKGIPWRHQGRSKFGVDCIGLVVLAAQGAGLDFATFLSIRDDRNYKRDPDPKLLALVEQCCSPAPAPIPGCLIVLQFPADRHPRHFALYTAEGNIIHAESRHGNVVEHGYRAAWPRWQHSLWKLPGVIYDA